MARITDFCFKITYVGMFLCFRLIVRCFQCFVRGLSPFGKIDSYEPRPLLPLGNSCLWNPLPNQNFQGSPMGRKKDIFWNHTFSLVLNYILNVKFFTIHYILGLSRLCAQEPVPGYQHKMVLCSHFEYPICDCIYSYSISPCQTSILKHELGSENKAVDCLELTKIVCRQGPSAYFCAEEQGWILVWVLEKMVRSHQCPAGTVFWVLMSVNAVLLWCVIIRTRSKRSNNDH